MKNVLVRKGDRGGGPALLEQLRIFGITVREVESAEEAGRLVEALGDVLLIADSQRLEREPAFAAELAELKRSHGASLRLLYYADRDDFPTRLGAVRAGGEAFFLLPVDAWVLADKIDALFKEREAPPYRVLIVDDDPEQVAYNALILQGAGMQTATATSADQVIPLLVETKPEIILMDMYMPGCSGTELASIVRQNEAFAAVPIIFLSVEKDLEKQISAIRMGCDEFLEKPIKPEHLVASVSLRAERSRSIRFYMERDALTGLLNHTNLVERLSNELLRSRRSGSILSFCLIDVDRMKGVNEANGHLTGDRVIRGASRLISERLRRTDIVGRYGGDQFAAILPGADGRTAQRLAEELRQSFGSLRHPGAEGEFSMSLSCGIATYPDFMSAAEIVEAAERALASAKAGGRNRVFAERPRQGRGG
ncbi:MAG TPA: diguanylate cyclase [Spirochaetia bacterium]|nr:diguanylate cyclase [Spirochaetia bacterium]